MLTSIKSSTPIIIQQPLFQTINRTFIILEARRGRGDEGRGGHEQGTASGASSVMACREFNVAEGRGKSRGRDQRSYRACLLR